MSCDLRHQCQAVLGLSFVICEMGVIISQGIQGLEDIYTKYSGGSAMLILSFLWHYYGSTWSPTFRYVIRDTTT